MGIAQATGMRTQYILRLEHEQKFYATHVRWMAESIRVWGAFRLHGRPRCYEFPVHWLQSMEFVGASPRRSRPRTARPRIFLADERSGARRTSRTQAGIRYEHAVREREKRHRERVRMD